MPDQEASLGFFCEFELAQERKEPCPKEPAALLKVTGTLVPF